MPPAKDVGGGLQTVLKNLFHNMEKEEVKIKFKQFNVFMCWH